MTRTYMQLAQYSKRYWVLSGKHDLEVEMLYRRVNRILSIVDKTSGSLAESNFAYTKL